VHVNMSWGVYTATGHFLRAAFALIYIPLNGMLLHVYLQRKILTKQVLDIFFGQVFNKPVIISNQVSCE
jgi:hypothetical protein